MMLRSVLLMVAIVLAGMPGVCRAQGADRLTAYSSRFYEIHTDLGRQELLEIAAHMDRVFAAYQGRFAGFRSRRRESMPLYLFRDRAGYVRFMRQHGVPAENSGGMFFVLPTAQGLATWTSQRSRSQTFEVLQHEGFHQFAHNYLGDNLPIWANEGLAQYFEDGIFVRGSQSMHLGVAHDQRLEVVKRALAEGRALPVESLVGMSMNEWNATLQRDPARSALLYAQAWSLAYFLIHVDGPRGGPHRQAFEQYLSLISSGRTSDRAFRQAFGISDFAPVQRSWAQYIQKLEPDPLTTAVTRLTFLGTGLQYLQEQKVEMPQTIEELRKLLQERAFRVTRTSHGVATTWEAQDEELYTYEVPGRRREQGRFRMTPSEGEGLPPTITAPDLRPRPQLAWSRNAEGELVMEIEYLPR